MEINMKKLLLFFMIINSVSFAQSKFSINSAPSSSIDYDNTTSGLTADNVKTAIDELAASGSGTDTNYVIKKSNEGDRNPLSIVPYSTNGAVTFIFDDCLPSTYTKVLPLFNSKNVSAVSAAISGLVNTVGYLTSEQLTLLQAAGWEIASHSQTHADLTAISEDSLDKELRLSKQQLEEMGLIINNLVYPFNYQNLTVRSYARKYYRSARGGSYAINPVPPILTYALNNLQFDDPTLLESYKLKVDTCAAQNRWVIFYLHDIATEDSIAVASLIDYIKSKDVPILTMNQALNIAGNRYEAGEGFYFTSTSAWISNIKAAKIGTGAAGTPAYPLHLFGGATGIEQRFEGTGATNKTRFLSNADGKFYIQSGSEFTEGSSTDIIFSGIFGSPARFTILADGKVKIGVVPEYADNAAAIAAGLVSGTLYRTSDAVKVVHP
jgi:peptidoglycan/xylan/chitin deacetylase (PgdA/CDA1 family)